MRKIAAAAGIFLMIFLAGDFSAFAAQALCSMRDGKPADGKTVLEKQGKKYEFCCSGCLQQFKDSPERFATEMRQPAAEPAEFVSAEATCSNVCSD